MRSKILTMLKNTDGYISGEEISRAAGISRTAVWKHINALRENGYKILSSTNRGYKLEAESPVTEELIKGRLKTRFIGRNIICMEETDSTNNECKRHSDMPDGTVFFSERQTGGRGRRGKSWLSPPGTGIWLSVLLKPNMRPENVSGITLAAGLAVCKALGCGSMIKYPNDIVIGTRKVCGILTELSAEVDAVNYVVCGIGINTGTESFDGELAGRATSLFLETGKKPDRPELIAAVLAELEPLYEGLVKDGLCSFITEYRKHCVTIGKEVCVTFCGKSIRGICTGIDDGGNITVTTPDKTVTLNSGEVSVRGIYGYI